MADKQSREGEFKQLYGNNEVSVREENILYRCINCSNHEVIENGIDGIGCADCGGHLNPLGYTNLQVTSIKTKSVGSFHVDIDCSDALTGLKAVQREAKKATHSLKELEKQQERMNYGVDFGVGKDTTVIYRPEVSCDE